jgi:hypothetical protein
MALTLLEVSKQVQNPIQQSVIEEFAATSMLLDAMLFETIAGNAKRYNKQLNMPGVAFRGINKAYPESTGVVNPQVESLAIGGGDLDVDKFLVATGGQGVREEQESEKITALTHGIERTIIQGDSVANPDEFDGLRTRLTGTQIMINNANGAALSLTNLDLLKDKVSSATHWIMNKTMATRISIASRNTGIGGFITFTQDQMGRRVTNYAGLPIIEIDDDERETAVLPFTEVQGSSSLCTSIYCVALRPNRMVGLQNGAIMVTDLGELQTKPCFRTRVEWYVGMALYHGRSAARLAGVLDAPVVA